MLRILCFLACIPSGGALLLKVWGLLPMTWGGLLFLACLPVLLVGYLRDAEIAADLRIGFWGGLVGTLGYDLVRVPFHYAGMRIFAPIAAYGVWLLGADQSSIWTESTGWLYHFSNGITFGWMYALVARRRSWMWGLLWGLALESIVLSTPFARMFHLYGNYQAIGLAYVGHIAYGVPLGLIVQRQSSPHSHLQAWIFVLVLAFCAGPVGTPGDWKRDARRQPGEYLVEGARLNPDWIRLLATGNVTVRNPESQPVKVRRGKEELEIPAGGATTLSFAQPGIYQLAVLTGGPTRSSFLIVEPAEKAP